MNKLKLNDEWNPHLKAINQYLRIRLAQDRAGPWPKVNGAAYKRSLLQFLNRKKLIGPPIVSQTKGAILIILHIKQTAQNNGISTFWLLACEQKNKHAIQWLLKNVHAHREHFKPGSTVEINFEQRWLLHAVLKNNMHIDSIKLFGNVKESLLILEKKLRGKPLWPDSFSTVPLSTDIEINTVLKLFRKEFRKRPQHCWFGADPVFLERLRKALKETVANSSPKSQTFLLMQNNSVKGCFSFDLRKDDKFRKTAGLNFCFDEAVQGIGISYYAYRFLMQQMSAAGIEYYQGNTSNPAVLRMGKFLKRKPYNIMLIHGPGYYAPSHFNL